MKIEIKSINGETIHAGEYDSYREAVEYCVKHDISLRRVNLPYTNLDGIDLHGVDLNNSNLEGTTFNGAKLIATCFRECNLTHCKFKKADLASAFLYQSKIRNGDFCDADLTNAHFAGADLTSCRFTNADLHNTKLIGVCASHSKFDRVNFNETECGVSDFVGARFNEANIANSNFYKCTLSSSIFCDAKIEHTIFNEANLNHSYLLWDSLKECDFEGANLYEAEIYDKERYRIGTFIKEPIRGYKKCKDGEGHYVIVELEIPAGAIVFSINGNKCRTNIAKVISIENVLDVAYSIMERKFEYRPGETVIPDDFDLQYNVECGNGIHFFKTREEAECFNVELNSNSDQNDPETMFYDGN